MNNDITNQQSLLVFIKANLIGDRNLSIRGLARLCGVDKTAIIYSGDFKSQKLGEILIEQGFEAGDLTENGFCARGKTDSLDRKLERSIDVTREVLLNVRASELGISQSLINRSDKQGYHSLGNVISRSFSPSGKTPHGRYMVNTYECTSELDNAILAYFNEMIGK